MSHQKLESDKEYRFFIGGIISSKNNKKFFIDSDHETSIIFIRLKLFKAHFITDEIFQTFTNKLN